MTPAARSIYYFSFYVLAAGIPMVLAPQLILEVLGFPVEGLDWIRFLGIVVLIVGYYYFNLGRSGIVPFFRWSVQMRILILPVFIALILVFHMKPSTSSSSLRTSSARSGPGRRSAVKASTRLERRRNRFPLPLPSGTGL